MPTKTDNINEFDKTRTQLQSLIDTDPDVAIKKAQELTGNINWQLLKAGIFIDAGFEIKSQETIKTGIGIFENAHSKHPQNGDIKYNLANGLFALAKVTEVNGPIWYQETLPLRRRAKKLYHQAAGLRSSSMEAQSQAYTNLGNLLNTSYRWVEAYDYFKLAIQKCKRNGVAQSAALETLIYAYNNSLGNEELLLDEISYLASEISLSIETIEEFAGKRATEIIKERIATIPQKQNTKQRAKLPPYLDFVKENNLSLSPTINSLKDDAKRWDDLFIPTITTDISRENVPEIFAMFNAIKSDYILARQIFYDGINKSFFDTGSYSDTLNYACYGVNEAAILLSQRTSMDILDKIAVATLFYLGISEARETNFRKCWFVEEEKDGVKNISNKIRLELFDELSENNGALQAMFDIATDLKSSAFLVSKVVKRNSSTHRFSVLHDMALSENKDEIVEHYALQAFIEDTLSTIKLCRAAIIYFVQMIIIREHRLHKNEGGFLMKIEVPSHHFIRGKDEEE